MGKGSDPPPPPAAVDANQSMGSFLFGDEWEGGAGITDDQFQQRLVEAEAKWGPEYVQNALGLQERAMFGGDGQEGMLGMYERSAPIVERTRAGIASAQRGSDVADVQRYGADALSAIRSADPEKQALVARQSQLTGDLYDRAGGLTPQQRRAATQTAREGAVARGRGMDNAGMFAEVLGREEFLRANRQEAQQSGQGLNQMLQGYGGDAMMAVLGRPSQSMAYNQQAASTAGGIAGQSTPQTFGPETGMNLALQNAQNQASYDQAIYGIDQQRSASTFDTMANLGGGIASAFITSDRRLKRDIIRVGTHPLGIGIYEYRYKSHPARHVGVMAQELLPLLPEAVVQ